MEYISITLNLTLYLCLWFLIRLKIWWIFGLSLTQKSIQLEAQSSLFSSSLPKTQDVRKKADTQSKGNTNQRTSETKIQTFRQTDIPAGWQTDGKTDARSDVYTPVWCWNVSCLSLITLSYKIYVIHLLYSLTQVDSVLNHVPCQNFYCQINQTISL